MKSAPKFPTRTRRLVVVPTRYLQNQAGALLVEAIVAILIFTIGILALIGVQATVMKASSDYQIRLDAEIFVDQLYSEMTMDGFDTAGKVDLARLKARFSSADLGLNYTRWRDKVTAAGTGLPGAGTNAPQVTMTAVVVGPGLRPAVNVNIIVFFRLPSDPATAPLRRVVSTTVLS